MSRPRHVLADHVKRWVVRVFAAKTVFEFCQKTFWVCVHRLVLRCRPSCCGTYLPVQYLFLGKRYVYVSDDETICSTVFQFYLSLASMLLLIWSLVWRFDQRMNLLKITVADKVEAAHARKGLGHGWSCSLQNLHWKSIAMVNGQNGTKEIAEYDNHEAHQNVAAFI